MQTDNWIIGNENNFHLHMKLSLKRNVRKLWKLLRVLSYINKMLHRRFSWPSPLRKQKAVEEDWKPTKERWRRKTRNESASLVSFLVWAGPSYAWSSSFTSFSFSPCLPSATELPGDGRVGNAEGRGEGIFYLTLIGFSANQKQPSEYKQHLLSVLIFWFTLQGVRSPTFVYS